MEIWKSIKGLDYYEISNFGRVKSIERKVKMGNGIKTVRERILKDRIRVGYTAVTISEKNIQKTFSVHRLIAEAFIPNTENKPQVNHINGIRNDNRIENLEWVSVRENSSHRSIGKKISSKYTGVSLYKKTNKWIARILRENKEYCLGTFNTEIEAHNAYIDALGVFGIQNKYAIVS